MTESNIKRNPVPNITAGQRAAALEKAARVRSERAALKCRLVGGETTLSEAMAEPCAARMRVYQLLRALPGIGNAGTDQIMRELHIDRNRRVAGLGCRQREALIARFEGCEEE